MRDVGASGEPSDKVGVRQPETLRAGSIRAKSFGFRMRPYARYDLAEPLDLDPNSLRQNDSIQARRALVAVARRFRGETEVPHHGFAVALRKVGHLDRAPHAVQPEVAQLRSDFHMRVDFLEA